jgi:hypothetical protein
MRSRRDLSAGRAMLARIEGSFLPCLAKQRLGQFQGEGSFSDPRRSGEQKAAGQSPPLYGPAKFFNDGILPKKTVPSGLTERGIHSVPGVIGKN